ncbi:MULTISPECIES: C40 family peptidase [unclassified Marinitoga]|uniref:C40 family peptidase n=1 Tax=unclassified Marinitoga TaxID=2640159 RepID=UPI0009503D99|nr:MULTISPECIES: C40 family peptidase [unclassified Marinitoga]APT75300.1 hypothetical protein LN42_02015 [Marinitoga sp. 1137]NUU96773.1 hypothetical protein [Marinitoga sp. 1138]
MSEKFTLILFLTAISILVFHNLYVELIPPTKWEQRNISDEEKKVWFNILPHLKGTPYKLGGQSIKTGFDCSGLIIYLYNKIGVKWFKYKSSLVKDVSANNLYWYNVKKISFAQIEKGDLIFFDTDNDGKIDHVAIFDKLDKVGNIWVWDATTEPDGIKIYAVTNRIIKNFWQKRPLFGKPLKVSKIY